MPGSSEQIDAGTFLWTKAWGFFGITLHDDRGYGAGETIFKRMAQRHDPFSPRAQSSGEHIASTTTVGVAVQETSGRHTNSFDDPEGPDLWESEGEEV